VAKIGANGHGSSEPPDKRPNVGEANALARPVLHARAPKQVENSLMVLGIYAPAVVGDFELSQGLAAFDRNAD